jgi:alkylation response protein AidB-like acyl-CoA dehydrogenase
VSISTASVSVSSLLDTVRQIEPVIRMHAADAERERRLSDEVTDAMRASGLYRLWKPQAFGGLEVDPVTAFQVIEAVARIDSAAGWNLQLSTGADTFGPWFGDDGAKDIFGQPDTIVAGSTFPPRRAVPVDGGYSVTGQTPFVSGAYQAQWFLGSAQIYDGDMPRLENGAPVSLLTACPANDTVIVDTWRTLGMRGTGSHDVVMSDVFVPSHHTAVMAPYEKPGSAYQGPLYKFTIWTVASVMASPALGIARAAIDDLLELAGRKTPSYLTTPLRDRSSVQALIGEAEATLGAGRASLYEALREVWDKACQGHVIDMPGKVKLQLAATYAVAAATRVVDLVHAAVGTTGIRDEHRFQRHFRDVHTITQHAFVSAGRYESGGQYFLGVPIEWPMFGL